MGNAFIDARCRKCKRRFGWFGTMAQHPPCQNCGYRPPQEELDQADAEMAALRDRVAATGADTAGDIRRQQRIDAGLTLRQAAKILDIFPSTLSEIERGDTEVSAVLAKAMIEAYGLDSEPT